MTTGADFRRLPAQDAAGWTCQVCGNPPVYGTSETVDGERVGVEAVRCTNCTAAWAAARGLNFPRLCTVEVR